MIRGILAAVAVALLGWHFLGPTLAVAILPSGPGVVYTHEQLAAALEAGGAQDTNVGAAIAQAESHGRSDAVCLNCYPGVTEYSVGPWQINLFAHVRECIADTRAAICEAKKACAMALACAAEWAAEISSHGRDWSAWSTYKSGAYRAYLAR